MALPSVSQIINPSQSTLFFTALLLLAHRLQLHMPSPLRWLACVILLLNWENWPLMWHWRVLGRVIIRTKLQRLLGRLGWRSPPGLGIASRAKELGLAERDWQLPSIGLSPFAPTSLISGRVTWSFSDIFLHMSNSCYSWVMDEARFQWASIYMISSMHKEGLMMALGGTSTVFFKELSMFQTFTAETRLAAYNDRWFFVLTIFTVAVSPNSTGKDIIVQTTRGPRILCCMGLSKGVGKIKAVKQTVPTRRALAACGFGEDASNWQHAQQLRSQRSITAWYSSEPSAAAPSGLEAYEGHNQRVLEVIGRLGGGEQKKVWLELLDAVQCSYPLRAPEALDI